GTLGCLSDCTFDTRGCVATVPSCGDGVKSASEECDGADLGGTTCATAGFTGGALACTQTCALHTSGRFNNVSVQRPISIPWDNAFWESFDANLGGFFVGDAEIAVPSRLDAYDGFWMVSVENTPYDPGSTAELETSALGHTLTAPPVQLSGVNVTQ